ncbi:Mss4-like protein [Rhodofomes roseus]|uniref:Mss4-like protein n=1 Tax=Rhodofomes roseus TaxID=34475 RepID=A0ABQ8K0Y8_9APHY|nr:Mss4-like protein [Rhodofomes roseus]KAH9830091.1 Mss4-like protein [Rhodofomes roseus]
MADIEGSCNCGAIKVRVIGGFGENAKAGICHCKTCQLLSGSLFSYLGFVSRENLKILQGEPKGYKQPAEAARSGKEVIRYFCGDCGTPLWAAAESAPETYSIKLAMFGNSLPPAMEIFWKHAHDWQKPIVPAEMVFEEWY